MSVFLEITTCTKCPNHTKERDYTEDSWEFCEKWHCNLMNIYVRRYVDWNDKNLFIHKDCPLPKKI